MYRSVYVAKTKSWTVHRYYDCKQSLLSSPPMVGYLPLPFSSCRKVFARGQG